MKEIIEFLNTSSEDGYLTKSEKQALKAAIEEKTLSGRELSWLRSQIFDIARSKIKGSDNIQFLDWLEAANKLILPKLHGETISKAYFSPGMDCINAINAEIGATLNNIDICVFTISDDRIANNLIYKHKKGVKIRILTDDDKINDMGSDIETLKKNGIEIKTDNSSHHMHNKFALFDGKKLLTGSYNWTRSAALYNQENIIVTNDRPLIERYMKEFKKLWGQMNELSR